MNILLHPDTKKQLDQFFDNPSHALLLDSPQGGGKYTLGIYLLSKLLGISTERVLGNQFVLNISPTKDTVTIESIRHISKFLQLKTFGSGIIRRAVLIEKADKMTVEAQNALLKVLEEPPTDTVIVLTASNKLSLLPTIRSRSQHITVKSPSRQDTIRYFTDNGFDTESITRSYYISDGLIGLTYALLTDDGDHELNRAIKQAKFVASSTVFERLSSIDAITKDKYPISEFLYALWRVYRAVLMQSVESGNHGQQLRAHSALTKIQETELLLANNPNPKLLLTDLLSNI